LCILQKELRVHSLFVYIFAAVCTHKDGNKYMEQLTRSIFTVVERVVCSTEENSLAVPVEFVKNNFANMARSIPNEAAASFQPGFIHFRPYNQHGLPSAFCPGAK